MISLDAYRNDPCGTLSIPYWKSKSITVPPGMQIVHQREFDASCCIVCRDEPYFRLVHDLTDIPVDRCGRYNCRTADEADLPLMMDIINRSYADLSVTEAQLRGYRETAAFAPDMWIIACDAQTKICVGCGIADFDPEAREGVLEWIQVLPHYRGRGAGRFIVSELLRRMADRADFATVSGRVDNATNPERLYRKCGFRGNDIWHVLREE